MSDPLLPFPWLDLVFILALIALNGVLSMSELAIVSSREARLRASEGRFRSLITNMRDIIFCHGVSGEGPSVCSGKPDLK